MACFLVSAAEAAIVTAVEKHVQKREVSQAETSASQVHIPMSRKLHWLSRLLWGGAALLAFEHVWHGEVVPWFPFLSAMSSPAQAAEMFHEMATTGVCMALLVTGVWLAMCAAADWIVSRPEQTDRQGAVS